MLEVAAVCEFTPPVKLKMGFSTPRDPIPGTIAASPAVSEVTTSVVKAGATRDLDVKGDVSEVLDLRVV